MRFVVITIIIKTLKSPHYTWKCVFWNITLTVVWNMHWRNQKQMSQAGNHFNGLWEMVRVWLRSVTKNKKKRWFELYEHQYMERFGSKEWYLSFVGNLLRGHSNVPCFLFFPVLWKDNRKKTSNLEEVKYCIELHGWTSFAQQWFTFSVVHEEITNGRSTHGQFTSRPLKVNELSPWYTGRRP